MEKASICTDIVLKAVCFDRYWYGRCPWLDRSHSDAAAWSKLNQPSRRNRATMIQRILSYYIKALLVPISRLGYFPAPHVSSLPPRELCNSGTARLYLKICHSFSNFHLKDLHKARRATIFNFVQIQDYKQVCTAEHIASSSIAGPLIIEWSLECCSVSKCVSLRRKELMQWQAPYRHLHTYKESTSGTRDTKSTMSPPTTPNTRSAPSSSTFSFGKSSKKRIRATYTSQ